MLKRIGERVLYKTLGHVPRKKPYVFGIGLSKTGTTTLADALGMLGCEAFHQPPIVRTDEAAGKVALDWPWWMSRYDAATDLTVAAVFAELRETFPNARFVYTWRDREAWLDSCRRYFTEARAARKEGAQTPANVALTRIFYGTYVFDRDLFLAAYDRHEAAVMRAFEGDPSFLSWGLTEDPRWEPLCAFLGRPVPREPFPFSNKDARGAAEA